MALVEAAIFHDPVGGALARARLAAGGIESVLFDTGLSGLGLGAMIPARLMVDEEDLENAQSLLSEGT